MDTRWFILALTGSCLVLQAESPAKPLTPQPAADPAYFKTGILNLQDRIWAQTQIERVWYNHRIWPKENPGSKPPFEQMVPAALIEKNATDVLRMGAALKQYWNVEITPPMLQAELDRMERESKDRATLHELFAVLRNDPFLIAETLGRENISRTLLREHTATNDNQLVEAISPTIRSDFYTLSTPLFDTAAGCDVWDTRLGPPPPVGRAYLTAVWSGSEMIVWGGYNGGYLNTGGRYNPATNSWKPTSIGANVPVGRRYHTAIWTGNEMIVWGGNNGGYLNTGGRYNPMIDSWTSTSVDVNVPLAREYHTAIWTGNVMIIWGGGNTIGGQLNSGGRYYPSADNWSPTALGFNVPAPRSLHTAVWTGAVMIIWGGTNSDNTGGRYDPVANSWTSTSTGVNAPTWRSNHTAVWTGSEMIIWGGIDIGYLNTGGRYNPTSDSWIPTSTDINVPVGRFQHTAIWTGGEMIVWGGIDGGGDLNTGSRYNPVTDNWTPTSTDINVPTTREYHAAIWTGNEMIVWGGYYNSAFLRTGGRYNPTNDSWIPTPVGTSNIPVGRSDDTAIWTGSEMIVWGGNGGFVNGYLNSGGRYIPSTDSWISTSTGVNVPTARAYHSAIWTGNEMIVWGGGNGSGIKFNSGGRYNPVSNSWIPTSISVNVPVRAWHSAVWTGSQMIIWGGSGDFSRLNEGGRYFPVTDSWVQIGTGYINTPTPRSKHTAIWTGSEMIIWGGSSNTSPYVTNTGGRFNPMLNTWTPTSISSNLPDARSDHTAIWTGNEMIIWGGGSSFPPYNTGGRYSPSTDSWTVTSLGANVPEARAGHTAIWTGNVMIIWSGEGTSYYKTGGRYNPTTDNWAVTSIGVNVPDARYGHTAIWTGSEMIIWGGYVSTATDPIYFNTGGLYSLAAPGSIGTTLRSTKNTTVNLNWIAITDATSYHVKRCTAICTPTTTIATPTTNSYSEPMDTISYFYAVEAVNSCGVTP